MRASNFNLVSTAHSMCSPYCDFLFSCDYVRGVVDIQSAVLCESNVVPWAASYI